MNIIPLGIWGGYPKANSATSSFLLEHDDFHCLVDCGSGVLASLQNYIALDQLDAVVISHYHADHIADIGSLQYSRLIQYYLGHPSPALPIYGHAKDEEQFAKLTYKEQTHGIEISEEHSVQIGPFTVSFCPTVHPVYCLAMKFTVADKSVVFTADTEWADQLVSFAKNTDLLISEANLYEEHIGKSPGHLAGSQAGKLASEANAGQLVLTHLPHHGDLQDILQAAQTTFAGIAEIAEVGKFYSL
ncbi:MULTISPECIES: MBL fold metallo-hydrolase [Sporosarcina]|uniref:Ribonuclease BN, tRNA processing enzyme n=2 Tax=Sporosarcina newyorkensis TaxID=759851 RepID=A0A1T4Y9R7_9BACL|nr:MULTISPECIES: MBL fold metallo-hydrolase [Sporosarcina]EGQ26350.1 metallo-beta-lactamase [Sporosarcina newyorkensis 2681]MBY0223749.1 MBL fold metallo-hydrolase [Sporosarcina aquimarina]SKA98519.1 Ribonuclease BN, tRNA processing enzyme [Sporosarcina newyorkensis]